MKYKKRCRHKKKRNLISSSLTLLTASPIALASLSPVNLNNNKLTSCVISNVETGVEGTKYIYLAKGFSPQHSVFFGPALAFLKHISPKQKCTKCTKTKRLTQSQTKTSTF